METYTAEELAEKARRELGADISPRTIYYYRQAGVLSPLQGAGSQPRFTDRHFLELAATLALQRAPDRPTLAEVARMMEGMSEEELEAVARAVGPTARELVTGAPAAPVVGSCLPLMPAPPGPAESKLERPGGARAAASRESLYTTRASQEPEPPGPSHPGKSRGPSGPAPGSPPAEGVTINLGPGVTLYLAPDAPRDLVARLLEVSLDHARERTGRAKTDQ